MKAHLATARLSDGSKVFDLNIEYAGQTITFPAYQTDQLRALAQAEIAVTALCTLMGWGDNPPKITTD